MSVDVSASAVKDLRERTGVGFSECKKALVEANGDVDAAIKILRERGVAKAEKRSGRAAAEGLCHITVTDGGKKAALVELNCETDFVSRNEGFQNLVAELSAHVNALGAKVPAGVEHAGETIAGLPYPAGSDRTLKDVLTEKVLQIGENLVFRRLARFETAAGAIAKYIHPPGKIGVLVEFDGIGADQLGDLGTDVAMHIAATKPLYLDQASVDPVKLEAEKEIYATKAKNEGKPEKIVPKIVESAVQKFFKDNCLLEQEFVKDPSKTVGKLLAEAGKSAGKPIKIVRFVCFVVGEGIEKPAKD